MRNLPPASAPRPEPGYGLIPDGMVPDISVAAPTTIGEAAYYMLVVVVLTFICVVSWKMLVTALHFWKDSAWLAANPRAMFHESGASGNILSRRGGRARNCLTVTVTQDGLSIRPTWLYGLLGGLTYRDFRIPIRRVLSVTENRRFLRRTVAVSYRSGMEVETLELWVRKPFRLVQAIAAATLQESRSRARRRRRARV